MSTQAKPTLIGAFVAGALALLVISLFILGNGRWFSDKQEFIIYFPESVNGLAIGAPVKFRGVKIGEVDRILIHYNQPSDNLSIPVIVSIDYSLIARHYTGGQTAQQVEDGAFVRYVKDGLRAKLEFQSFVTGVLYVELDYYSRNSAPPRPVQVEPIYPEIPALESTTNDLMKAMTQTIKNISEINFTKISSNLSEVLENLNRGVKEIQFKEINDRLVSVLNRADQGLGQLDFKTINQKLVQTLDGADRLLNSPEIMDTVMAARTSLKTADEAFSALRDMMRPDSVLNYQLDTALGEMAEAARAFRQFADFLDRNPSALLTGRAPPRPDVYGPDKEARTKQDNP